MDTPDPARRRAAGLRGRLHVRPRAAAPSTRPTFSFAITGPDGDPVTRLRRAARPPAAPDRRQPRPPRSTPTCTRRLAADGTWTVERARAARPAATGPSPTSSPTGGRPRSRSASTSPCPAPVERRRPARRPPTHDEVAGFEVDARRPTADGGTATVTVRRDGEVVTTEPYLGAAGHLVALRDGDLAYLHVHPLDEVPAGPVRLRGRVPVGRPLRPVLRLPGRRRRSTPPASSSTATPRRLHAARGARIRCDTIRRRPRDRRDDLRVLRGPDREAPQPPRRRDGRGELRHRAGPRSAPEGVTTDELIAEVEAAGYAARVPAPADAGRPPRGRPRAPRPRRRRAGRPAPAPRRVGAASPRRWSLFAMVPSLQIDGWQWLSLTLAAPVATWGAWPFHRATWVNLRHGASHDGHARVGRRARRVRLVALRAVPRARPARSGCATASRSRAERGGGRRARSTSRSRPA